jgi:hypothetical protein
MGFMQSKNRFKNQSGGLYVFHKAHRGHYQNNGAQGKSTRQELSTSLIAVIPSPMGFTWYKNQCKNQSEWLYVFCKACCEIRTPTRRVEEILCVITRPPHTLMNF